MTDFTAYEADPQAVDRDWRAICPQCRSESTMCVTVTNGRAMFLCACGEAFWHDDEDGVKIERM